MSRSAWRRAFLTPPRPRPAFIDAADQAGLRFVHDNGATGQYFMPELLGAGVAVFDYDNDGDLDVYLVQDAPIDGARPHTGNRLFRNDGVVDGMPHFTDVTAQAGVGLKASAWESPSETSTTTGSRTCT